MKENTCSQRSCKLHNRQILQSCISEELMTFDSIHCQLTQINDELRNLESGNPFLPPDPNPPGSLKIVPVHHDVDGEIESNWHPRYGRVADQLRVAKEGRCTVMIAMKKSCETYQHCHASIFDCRTQWFLFQHKENRVEELQIFRKIIQLPKINYNS